MPQRDDVEYGLRYIILHDEAITSLLYLLLPFATTSNLECEVAYLRIGNAGKHDIVADTHLIEEENLTHIVYLCTIRTKVVD